MRVAGEDERVADLVLVEVVENSVAIGAVPIPSILMYRCSFKQLGSRNAVALTTSTDGFRNN